MQSFSPVILEPKKIKSLTASIVIQPIWHKMMGPDATIFVFWILSFKPAFSLSSFTLIKRLFGSSLLSAIRVVPSAYLRLLVFLLAIFIPAYASSSLPFCMMYSAYKLNKQGDKIQSWCIPFPVWNQSIVPFPFLTVASCHAYKFLKRQVRWSHLLKNFPQFVAKGFNIVNWAEVCLFCFCFFFDQMDVGNLISGSFAFSKSSLYIWKFSVYTLLKSSLRDFEH